MTADAQASGKNRRSREHSVDADPGQGDAADRKWWMSVLAKANAADLADKVAALNDLPQYAVLRPAESGSVMVRGRAGGTGSPFNMGEMSVTRCVVQLAVRGQGAVIGHAYVAGRNKRHAESAALLDAMLQTETWGPAVREKVVTPLAQAAESARRARLGKVAATKVNFFTMVRGEN